ncbi:MAG: AraC family transcriptional regulator [Lachnospiraceae bacterium]
MNEKLFATAQKYSEHIANLCGTTSYLIDHNSKEMSCSAYAKICEQCIKYKLCHCNAVDAYIQGYEQAYQWDGMYIYLCELGLVLAGFSISDEDGDLTGGLLVGPCCLGTIDDNLQDDFPMEVKETISGMPSFTVGQIQSMAEIVVVLTEQMSEGLHTKSKRVFYQQETLVRDLYTEKMRQLSDNTYYMYPIKLERELRMAIRSQDKENAQIILNQILATIYVSNDSNIERMKPRITELLIVISRAALEVGADGGGLPVMTQDFARELDKINTIEDMSAWLSAILQTLIKDTFDFNNIKHGEIIFNVVEYIKRNYMKNITLDDIAQSTYVSKAYLSSLFKKETGKSISHYINCVRVDKSKLLLLNSKLGLVEVADLCGFGSQSYFTKIFHSIVGVTPKKYREERGKK